MFLVSSRSNAQTSVFAWGDGDFGATNVPAWLTNVIAVSFGGDHALVLKGDGTMTAWGDNNSGQAQVPAGLSNVVAIAAGGSYNLALLSDGTVSGWGANAFGAAVPPADLSNVVKIAATSDFAFHNVALKSDGTVVAWGDNIYGESTVPPGLSNVVDISAGGMQCLAVKSDGTVVAWGSNLYGESTVPAGLSNVVAVAGSGGCSIALINDGHLVVWGNTPLALTPRPANLTNVVAIAGGGDHFLILKSDGTVSAWGTTLAAQFGQTNVPAGLTNVTAIAASELHNIALVNPGHVQIMGPEFDQTNFSGRTINLGVLAVGPSPLSYRWQQNGMDLPSATGPTLILTNLQTGNAGVYTVTVSSANGSDTATNARVTVVNSAPILLSQPSNQMILSGNSVAVQATGSVPISYQWRLNGVDIPGANSATLNLTNSQFGGPGVFAAVISNAYGVTIASNILLNMIDVGHAADASNAVWTTTGDALWVPQTNVTVDGIAAAQSGTITNGQKSTLQALVTGPGTLTYYWKVSSQPSSDYLQFSVNGAQQAAISGEVRWEQETFYVGAGAQLLQWTYSKGTNGTAGQDAGWVDEVVFTPGGTGPIAVDVPTNQLALLGNDVTFATSDLGTPPISYQWQLNNSDIAGATNALLTLTNVQLTSQGNYRVLVNNAFGMVTTSNATLSVQVLAGWGKNFDDILDPVGEAMPPLWLTNVTAISGGGFNSLALNSDGTVVAWGSDRQGQCDLPDGLSNVVAIAAGYWHGLALKNDGTVVAWGNNYNISGNYQGATTVPVGLSNVVAIAAGGGESASQSLALRNDGTVVGWGSVAVPAGLSNIVAIAAGGQHGLALKNDGTVVGWGFNFNGQATPPPGLTNVVAIAAGGYHSMVLKSDGTVVTWGNNSGGQTNIPPGLGRVVAIDAGSSFNIVLQSDGSEQAWGENNFGQINIPAGLHNGVAIAAGDNHVLSLLNNGNPYIAQQPRSQTLYSGLNTTLYAAAVGPQPMFIQWQLNGTNIPGATNFTLSLTNVQPLDAGNYTLFASNGVGWVMSSNAAVSVVTSPPVISFQSTNLTLFGGADTVFAPYVTGSVPMSFQWRLNGTNVPGATNATLSLNNLQWSDEGTYTLIVSNQYGLTTSSNAGIYMPPSALMVWGGNSWGQTNIPPGLTNVISIAAGFGNCLAALADGTVRGWGYNGWSESTPPKGLSNVVVVATSPSGNSPFSLALRNDGTVIGWGNNSGKQTNIPSGLSNVVSIAAGQQHSLALRIDGKVFAWGNNSSGQTNVPFYLTNAVTIAAGLNFNLAATIDGNVVAWGDNSSGQTNIPPALTNVVAVAAGSSHCLALRDDGTVVAWGSNSSGQTNVPPSLSNVVAIAAGYFHSLAVRKDGTIVAWGQSNSRQTNVPAGLNLAVKAAGGDVHSMALLEGGPLVIAQQPANQIADAGTSVWWQPIIMGGNPISYQWSLNGTNIPGATNAVLYFAGVQLDNAGNYTLAASNSFGQVLSSNAVLTVLTHPPGFISQPSNTVAFQGSNAFFNPVISGTAPISLQWQFNGSNLPGATNLSLAITNVQSANLGSYSLIATNIYGSATSSNAVLAFLDLGYALNAPNLPWTSSGANAWFAETNFTADGIAAAQSGKITFGQVSTLQTTVTGPGTLSFFTTSSAGGTGSSSFRVIGTNNLTTFLGGGGGWGKYTFYLGDGAQTLQWNYSAGFSGSNIAWLDEVTISPGATVPFLSSFPANQVVKHGTNVSFSVLASGTPPIRYQWQFNGTNLNGATLSALSLTNVQTVNSGLYSVIVSNGYGSVSSSNAVLTVRAPLFHNAPGNILMTPQGFSMQLNGLTGHGPVTIFASSNLLDWYPIFTNPPTSGTMLFLDTNAVTQPFQFYRASEQ